MTYLWVVEMFCEYKDGGGRFGSWMPTVGVGLNRVDGRKRLAEWKEKNSAKFRLRKYSIR